MADSTPTSYWGYKPTKGVSTAFAILFAISGGLHLWQNNLKYKGAWRIGFLLPWSASIFVAGFALREYGAYHPDKLNIFIASTVLLFLAPPAYNAANYIFFGRVLFYLPYLSPLHPGRVWTTFVALDALDGVIAGNGAALAANSDNTDSQVKLGIVLVKVSLFLLLGMYLGFMYLIVNFHRRCLAAKVFTRKVKVVVWVLYVSSFLILIRNTFRTASFFYPEDSTANGKEWPFWVLEVVPMVLNTYLMNVYPPMKYLPRSRMTYLALDGKTELEGPGMIDTRPFLLSFFDPFDVVGLVTGKDHKNRFWEHDGVGGPARTARLGHGMASHQAAEGVPIKGGD